MEINEESKSTFEGIFEDGIVDTEYSSSIKLNISNIDNENSSGIFYSRIINGSLPPGLSLIQNNEITIISGIPTKEGTYTFVIRVIKPIGYIDQGCKIVITKKFSGTFDGSLVINGIFDDCELGKNYRTYYTPNKIILSGQRSPYIPTVIKGELPSGLSVVRYGNDICLVGTPNQEKNCIFTLRFTGRENYYREKEFSVNVSSNNKTPYFDKNMSILNTFCDRFCGVNSSNFITVFGGIAHYKYEIINGMLPPGVSLIVKENCIYLEGAPTQNGSYSFTIRVTGKHNGYTERKFSINVSDTFDNDMYINSTFPNATRGERYCEFVYTNGRATSYNPTISKGTLPPGLELKQSMIRTYLEGTPAEEGTYNFTLRVTGNNHRYTEKSFIMLVNVGINDDITILPDFKDGMVGNFYSGYARVSTNISSYTANIVNGLVPEGLTLKRSGDIIFLEGTPNEIGSYSFTLRVTGSDNSYNEKICTIIIK